jgi:hypothetical protein
MSLWGGVEWMCGWVEGESMFGVEGWAELCLRRYTVVKEAPQNPTLPTCGRSGPVDDGPPRRVVRHLDDRLLGHTRVAGCGVGWGVRLGGWSGWGGWMD